MVQHFRSREHIAGKLGCLPWFNMRPDEDSRASPKPADAVLSMGNTATTEKSTGTSHFDLNLLGWPLLSFLPWTVNTRDDSRSTIAINEGCKTIDNDPGASPASTRPDLSTATTTIEKPKQNVQFDLKLLTWSLPSLLPWTINARDNIYRTPTTINKRLKRRVHTSGIDDNCGTSLRFRPYVSKVPWHTGPRGFLSQFFPRYGHYCGPNWSSGKDGGSPLWDRRPIDWLDYCCYCHDIGYDTHDQAKLLKADLEFLECLERPHMVTKGDAHIARLYKMMCITGLRNFLIPYRKHLVNLQFGQPLLNFGWLTNVKWRAWISQKT